MRSCATQRGGDRGPGRRAGEGGEEVGGGGGELAVRGQDLDGGKAGTDRPAARRRGGSRCSGVGPHPGTRAGAAASAWRSAGRAGRGRGAGPKRPRSQERGRGRPRAPPVSPHHFGCLPASWGSASTADGTRVWRCLVKKEIGMSAATARPAAKYASTSVSTPWPTWTFSVPPGSVRWPPPMPASTRLSAPTSLTSGPGGNGSSPISDRGRWFRTPEDPAASLTQGVSPRGP